MLAARNRRVQPELADIGDEDGTLGAGHHSPARLDLAAVEVEQHAALVQSADPEDGEVRLEVRVESRRGLPDDVSVVTTTGPAGQRDLDVLVAFPGADKRRAALERKPPDIDGGSPGISGRSLFSGRKANEEPILPGGW